MTFILVPQRSRIVCAKVVVSILLTVLTVCAAMLVTLATAVLRAGLGGTEGWLAVSGGFAGSRALIVNASMHAALGGAIGLLFTSSSLAIVVYLVSATVVGTILSLIGDTALGAWLSFEDTVSALAEGQASAEMIGSMAVTILLWVLMPASLGLLRYMNRDIDH